MLTKFLKHRISKQAEAKKSCENTEIPTFNQLLSLKKKNIYDINCKNVE